MMTDSAVPIQSDDGCWRRIGVWGDGTCVELPPVGHCRNCAVYAAGGRRLLDRLAPDDYIDAWTAALAEEKTVADASAIPHLIFRIGQSWLAFRATTLREITEPKSIRTVPHRPRAILLGLVNVRGELHPCVSLHALFSEAPAEPPPRTARFVVAGRPGEDWVFPVDEIDAMHQVGQRDVEPLPVTLTSGQVVYTHGLFHRGERVVALIDEELLFSALARRIA